MFQQRWRSKRLLRGYHGDWIPERRFKRWFLPSHLPDYAPEVMRSPAHSLSRQLPSAERASDTPVPPITMLMMREVERRLDVVVFRCCFAHSASHARMLVLHGKVSVNGMSLRDPGHLLEVGDLISVQPESIPMLNPHLAKRIAKQRSAESGKEVASESVETKHVQEEAAEKPADESEQAEVTAERPTEHAEALDAKSFSSETEAATEHPSQDAEAVVKTSSKEAKQKGEVLPPGVYPFNLPPFAAPFLFIPPYLEISFRTCSAIYLRHPTLTTHLVRNASQKSVGPMRVFSADIPSPYPAGGEMFGLAWEHYARNSPRVRSEERRTKVEGRYGRKSGFITTRSWEKDRRRVAIRRGWGRKREIPNRSPKL